MTSRLVADTPATAVAVAIAIPSFPGFVKTRLRSPSSLVSTTARSSLTRGWVDVDQVFAVGVVPPPQLLALRFLLSPVVPSSLPASLPRPSTPSPRLVELLRVHEGRPSTTHKNDIGRE